MFNWNVVEKTYVYDGTFEGLLSIVFDCYIKKVIPLRIESKNNIELNFLDTLEEKITDYEKSNRIFNGIVKNISYDTLYNSYYAFLSNTKEKALVKGKMLYMPIRIKVTGVMHGPELPDTIYLLGKELVLKRLSK